MESKRAYGPPSARQGLEMTAGRKTKITRIALAASILLPVFVPLVMVGTCVPARAADFKNAKKIVVPATTYPRRLEYTSNNRESGIGPSYGTYAPDSASYGASAGSKSGLVPPPPPVTPGLLPSSLQSEVPPPPPAPSLSGGLPFSPSSSRSMTPQKVSGDPTRQSAAARNIANSEANKTAATSAIVESATSHADILVKQGKLQEAQALLEKYHKTYPTSKPIKTKLGEVSLARAKFAIRHDNYEEGVEQARLALSYAGQSPEAKSVLDQALKHQGVDPKSHSHRLAQGDMLYGQGKEHLAKVEYESAKQLHGASADPHIGLGNVALKQGKLKEAKTHYQQALEKNPNSHIALRQLGIVRYKQKDVVGANSDLSRALVLNPEDKIAGDQLVELWHRQVSARPNDANAHLGLARAYQLKGDLKSAQNEYRTVVKIDAEHPNLPAARQSFKLALARQEALRSHEAARTLEASGALQDAFNKAGEAVDLSPGDVPFRMYQAELAEKLGNLGQAKQLYLEVLRKDSKNTVAAQRIQALAGIDAVGGSSADTLPPVAPAHTSNGALKATAGSLAGLLPGGTTGAANAGEGAALPYLPGPYGAPITPGLPLKSPSSDHVTNMSGFLSQLRDHTLKQQKQLKDQEDAVRVGLGIDPPRSSKKSAGASALGSLPPDLSASDATSTPAFTPPQGMITSSDISKLLSGSSTDASTSSDLLASTGGALSSIPDSGFGATDSPASDLRTSDPITKTATANQPATAMAAKPQSLYDSALTAGKNYLGGKLGLTPSSTSTPVPVSQATQMPPTAPPIGSASSAMGNAGTSTGSAGGIALPNTSTAPVGAPSSMSSMLQGLSSRFPAGIPASLAAAAANFMAPAGSLAGVAAGAASGAPKGAETLAVTPNLVGAQNAPPAVPSTSPFNVNNLFSTQGNQPSAMNQTATGPATRLPWSSQSINAVSSQPAGMPATNFSTAGDPFGPPVFSAPDASSQSALAAPAGAGLPPSFQSMTAGLPPSLQNMAASLPPDVQAQLSQAVASGNLDPAVLAAKAQGLSKNVTREIKDAYRRLGSLESQNKQLVAELKTAQQQIKELQATQKSMLKHKGEFKNEPGASSQAGDLRKSSQTADLEPVSVVTPQTTSGSNTPGDPTDNFLGPQSNATVESSELKLRGPHQQTSSEGTQATATETQPGKTEKHTARKEKQSSSKKVTKSAKQTEVTEDVEGQLEKNSGAPQTVSKYLVPTGPVDHPPALFQTRKQLSALHFEKQAGKGSAQSTFDAATAASAVPLVASSAPAVASSTVPQPDTTSEVPGLKLSPLKSEPAASTPAPESAMFGSDGSVRLELTGVKVQQKNIKLNVTFRNNGKEEIVIPGSTKAILRIVGEPDQAVKVRFDKKTITGGAAVAGEINLPGTKLDPTADVFLPKIVSSANGPKDVHLTVPISALNTRAN